MLIVNVHCRGVSCVQDKTRAFFVAAMSYTHKLPKYKPIQGISMSGYAVNTSWNHLDEQVFVTTSRIVTHSEEYVDDIKDL